MFIVIYVTNSNQQIGHALRRLAKLPMSLELLSSTGVGRAVNQLRTNRIHGTDAQSIVAKWKDVARNAGIVNEHHVSSSSKRKHSIDNSSSKKAAPSFEDILASSDCAKTRPKKIHLDWSKHAGTFDTNYRPKPMIHFEPSSNQQQSSSGIG